MKLKTEQEIGLIACEYADQCQKNRPQIAWVLFDVKEAYKKGYTQAQQDILASASEGFDDYLASHDQGILWSVDDNNDEINLAERVWQAARLSVAKEFEELKKQNENLRKLLDSTNDLRKTEFETFLNLKKENEALEKENKFQVDVMCDMGEVVLENEKLQQENEELIDQLKWALSCLDLNLNESDWGKAFRLMVIHGVSHDQVCWDHPELIEEAKKIKGEAK